MTQGATDSASMGRGLEGRSRQEMEPALGRSGDAQGAGLGSARPGGEEAEPGYRPSLRPVSVMTHGPGAGPKRVTRGLGGGVWPPPETLDQVVRRGFRRPQCVRRTARGQSGRTGESKPETASSRSVWSQDAEHPGSRLQHVSTAPTPCAAFRPHYPPRSCLLRACGQVPVPPRAPSLCLWFPPRACRTTPTQSQAPEAPLPDNSTVCHPLGGRGKPRHRRDSASSLRTQGPRPQSVGSVLKGLNLGGRLRFRAYRQILGLPPSWSKGVAAAEVTDYR